MRASDADGALERIKDSKAQRRKTGRPVEKGVSEQAGLERKPSQANKVGKGVLPTGSQGIENHTSGIILDIHQTGKHS